MTDVVKKMLDWEQILIYDCKIIYSELWEAYEAAHTWDDTHQPVLRIAN